MRDVCYRWRIRDGANKSITQRADDFTNMRDRITFKCSVCGEENYIGTRNKKKHPERMTVKKYCPKCNQQTEHKEKK